MPPSLNRSTYSCTVRRFTPAKSEAVFVEWPLNAHRTAIILLLILMSFSTRMASVIWIFLLFSIMDGSAIRRSISFSVIAYHEAKFSMSVTLDMEPVYWS